MDRDKVIKGLECCFIKRSCTGCPYYRGLEICKIGVGKDALALLKEQEAVEPKEIVNEHYPIGDYRRTVAWLCGKCGKWLVGNGNYCSYCGKAVKWE